MVNKKHKMQWTKEEWKKWCDQNGLDATDDEWDELCEQHERDIQVVGSRDHYTSKYDLESERFAYEF